MNDAWFLLGSDIEGFSRKPTLRVHFRNRPRNVNTYVDSIREAELLAPILHHEVMQISILRFLEEKDWHNPLVSRSEVHWNFSRDSHAFATYDIPANPFKVDDIGMFANSRMT